MEVVTKGKKQLLALLSLCCPHLHLVTITHAALVSSEALGLSGSMVAVSSTVLYTVNLSCTLTFLLLYILWKKNVNLRSVYGPVALSPQGYSSHEWDLKWSQIVNQHKIVHPRYHKSDFQESSFVNQLWKSQGGLT